MLTDFLSKYLKPSQVTNVKSYGAMAIAIGAIIALVMLTDGKKERSSTDKAEKVNIVTSSNSRELGLDAVRDISKNTAKATQNLEKKVDDLEQKNKDLTAQARDSIAMAKALKAAEDKIKELEDKAKEQEDSMVSRMQSMIDTAIDEAQVKNILSVDTEPKRTLNNDDRGGSRTSKLGLPIAQRRPATNGQFSYGGSAGTNEPMTNTVQIEQPRTTSSSSDVRNSSLFVVSEPKEEVKEKPESSEIYLPKTSILTGVLITGLDAPTHGGAQDSPYPVLVRIKKEAVLANFKTLKQVKECFALMSGYGDLSTERAMLRGEGITCVKKDGETIERKMSGYAAGEDGKAGLKGTLVSRNSTVLVNAMMAGFASGVSSAFNVTPVATYTTNDDGTQKYQDVFNSNAAQGGLATGASTAMEKLADYYMNLANQMHPIIEIGAGRVIDIILTEGADLGVAKQ
jgi:conjugal transfer pilus assembly protein TraB